MSVDLVILRHAPTQWNEDKVYQGRTDIPLSEKGRTYLQERQIPAQFKKYQIFSSPLSRAKQTAELLGFASYTIEPRLAEADCGSWEGRKLEEVKKELDYSQLKEGWGGTDFKPHGGESVLDLQKRLQPWLLQRFNEGQPTLAFAHKGVMMALMGLALNWDMWGPAPQKIDFKALQWLRIQDGGRLEVVQMNIPLELR